MSRKATYSETRDIIYQAAADPKLWPNALETLCDHLGALGTMLVHNAPSGLQGSLTTARLREDLSEIYLQRHVWNPWSKAIAKQPFHKSVSASSLIERRLIRRSEFDADILTPQSIEDMVCLSLPSMARDGGAGGFGVALSSRGADNSLETVRKLDRLQPHLARALELSFALAERQQGARQLAAVLEFLPNAALLLGSRGQVLYANGQAENLLKSEDGIAIALNENSRLRAWNAVDDRNLRQRIAEAAAITRREESSLGGYLKVRRPSGSMPLSVLVSPLPPAEFEICQLPTSARMIVLITDLTAPFPIASKDLSDNLGLTRAEARVALLVGAGHPAPQVAAMLGVALPTVKTQIAHIFRKLDIHSQAALARILSTFPKIPGNG